MLAKISSNAASLLWEMICVIQKASLTKGISGLIGVWIVHESVTPLPLL
jgi:hypothetical protein